LILPNGSTIHVKTVQQIKAIERKIAAREPIVVSYTENGVRKERTLWHPDDPMRFPPVPGYSKPPGRARRLLRRFRDFLRVTTRIP
jgi:hypothetical protein